MTNTKEFSLGSILSITTGVLACNLDDLKDLMVFMVGEDGDNREAKFNMAVATLQRIHISLEKIRWGFEFLRGIQKQEFHISQVKILFMNATPLLEEAKVKEYEKEIDGLKLKLKTIRGRQVTIYDSVLEARLFEIVREWTLELKKYFMPSKVEDGDDY